VLEVDVAALEREAEPVHGSHLSKRRCVVQIGREYLEEVLDDQDLEVIEDFLLGFEGDEVCLVARELARVLV
jgi:hypothetical protein